MFLFQLIVLTFVLGLNLPCRSLTMSLLLIG